MSKATVLKDWRQTSPRDSTRRLSCQRFDCWIDIAKSVALGRGNSFSTEPGFEEQKKELAELLKATLSSYAAALLEAPEFSDSRSRRTASIELLRQYRLFTRAVCVFAKEMWPEVDLAWLMREA